MCGRFSLLASFDDLREFFQVEDGFNPEPRYNIAPSQDIAVVRLQEGQRRLVPLRWGLLPFWADDPKIDYRTINARSETVHKAPSFRAAFRSRRCLIPASGFYEWQKLQDGKQPYYIFRTDNKPMAFAGLWEHWENKEGEQIIESCTILTTEASEPVSALHNRMPVILEPGDFDLWLDPTQHDLAKLQTLLHPAAPEVLSMYPVSKYVNKAGNEGHECIEPVEGH